MDSPTVQGGHLVLESPMTKLSNEIGSRLAVESPCALGAVFQPVSSTPSAAAAAAAANADAAAASSTPMLQSQRMRPPARMPPPLSTSRGGMMEGSVSVHRMSTSLSDDMMAAPDDWNTKPNAVGAGSGRASSSEGGGCSADGCDGELAAFLGPDGVALLDVHPNRSLWPNRDEASPAASTVDSPFEPERNSKKRGLGESKGESFDKESMELELKSFSCDAAGTDPRPLSLHITASQLFEPPLLESAQSPVLAAAASGRRYFDDPVCGGGGGAANARLTSSLDAPFSRSCGGSHQSAAGCRPVPLFSKSESLETLPERAQTFAQVRPLSRVGRLLP